VAVRLNARLGIARRDDCSRFNHENYGPFRGAGAMNNAFGYNKALVLLKLDTSILEIDDETTLQYKEELVVIVVFVPVILALHYA
jgi:hypothetical protein